MEDENERYRVTRIESVALAVAAILIWTLMGAAVMFTIITMNR